MIENHNSNHEPNRIVFCQDALSWIEKNMPIPGSSIVTSLPDVSELPKLSLEKWATWFLETAHLLLCRTPPEGVTVFYQSDIKSDGKWIDKGYLIQKAAERAGASLLWHKIGCRVPPGESSYGRVGYSHILAFSREVSGQTNSLPDVLPEIGEKSWERGMGRLAAKMITDFIAEHTATRTVVNPFCGQGTVLAAAQESGLSAIGIERSAKRAEIARSISI